MTTFQPQASGGDVAGPSKRVAQIRCGARPTSATVVLLTLLAATTGALGYGRMLRTNTAKHRVYSLFRPGFMLYDLIPTMPETRPRPLMERFSLMLEELPLVADVFELV
jgi:hypothetical protein